MEVKVPTDAIWVKWIDSCGQEGWTSQSDVDDLHPAHIMQIGYLLREDDDCIVLSPTAKDGGAHTTPYHAPIAIPKVAILERGHVSIVPAGSGPLSIVEMTADA